ncbi:MAG: M60 family metallopeptidase, partial [Saprospiraceae bacterium]
MTYTARINGSMPHEYGKRTAWSSTPARRPTGYYLAPGTMATVKVPYAIINKGFTILVGAHSFDRKGNNNVKRLFRVTDTFPIVDTITHIANPFGGGIYILTPYEAAEGIVEIQLTNVVPAPFFSATTFDKTTLDDWLNVQRHNPAPWADFETDKFMMQVPSNWIFNYADPITLMKDWDDRMDVVSRLLGYPALRNNTLLYLQVDVGIMYGFYGIGNPQVNNDYNPLQMENGNKNHWFLRPGVSFWETEFHEMGHAQLFSKFPGETEAAVNLLAAAIYNRLYGIDIDTALGNSFGPAPYITRDQAALNWMVTPNFRAGNPMDISNTTKDEVRYQQRGYAKYVEMAALFGWEVIDAFYKQEQLDFIAQTPGDGLSDVDSRILRFSKEAGTDMRPLIHFWGVHPQDSLALSDKILENNLQPSKFICERLEHYKSIIPLNNAEFAAHAAAFFGGSVPAGGDPDYGSGWYNIWLPLYNETHGALAVEAMNHIIDEYFPDGCPTETLTPVVTVNSPAICEGDFVILFATGATTYTWSNGEEGDHISVMPSATTTYTVIGKTAGFPSQPTDVQVIVIPIPIVNVSDESICRGDSVVLTPSGAESYVWQTGDTTNSLIVSPTMTTTYAVTGSTAGCLSATVYPVVEVFESPMIDLGPDMQLSAGQDTILDATGPDLTYLWSTGETTPAILVNTDGLYSVTVTNSKGCSMSDTIEVTVVTSAFSPELLPNIKLAPNPTHDKLYIRYTGSSTTSVQVFDNLGRMILSDHSIAFNGASRTIDLRNQEPGMYFVRVAEAGWTRIFPVIKY